jgi:hypothetical protein
VPAQRKDTAARGDFAKCIIKHIDEWFAFARERGLGISREDIILVTGCHLTGTWATIAFREEGEQVSFGAQVSGVSNAAWQFTPEGAQGVAYNLGPSGQVGFCILFLPQQTATVTVMVELFRIRIYRRISAYSLEASVLAGFRLYYQGFEQQRGPLGFQKVILILIINSRASLSTLA